MPKKETTKGLICRYIACAFEQAAMGEETKARGLWKSAKKLGYIPNPHTEKGLEIAIAKGIKETRRDTL